MAYKSTVISVAQAKQTFHLAKLRAADLARISYVAIRGESKEEGAVQRTLNRVRIAGIRDFTLAGGNFPSCVVLNWVDEKNKLQRHGATMTIPLVADSAQIVDGQHRVAGIREAIKAKSSIGSIEIPVAIYENLTTQECADIFLSINTEQKPVPRSLVYDLYGIASEYIVDDRALRAKDIADRLNEDEESPYKDLVKYPGAASNSRGIALSSIANAVRSLVEEKGAFEQVGVDNLEQQGQVLLNWFGVLRNAYGSQWDDKDNVFLYASGFSGAVDFLKNKMLTYCNLRSEFDYDTMAEAMRTLQSNLIWQRDVAGMQGRRSTATISELLTQVFTPASTSKKKKF